LWWSVHEWAPATWLLEHFVISRISGELVAREKDRVEIATAGGVTYEVLVPASVVVGLPVPGEKVSLYTHHLIREDHQALFGFAAEADKLVFVRLISASGVGPKIGLALLSAMPANRIVRAIREKDVAALSSVTGVGKKLAEKLIADLASKVGSIPVAASAAAATPGSGEAVRALTSLGFSHAEAERAVAAVMTGDMDSTDLIRRALAHTR
jgi:holliday junction DNA helicase RuvA